MVSHASPTLTKRKSLKKKKKITKFNKSSNAQTCWSQYLTEAPPLKISNQIKTTISSNSHLHINNWNKKSKKLRYKLLDCRLLINLIQIQIFNLIKGNMSSLWRSLMWDKGLKDKLNLKIFRRVCQDQKLEITLKLLSNLSSVNLQRQ